MGSKITLGMILYSTSVDESVKIEEEELFVFL